jgi:hypothetical protein
MTAEPRQPHHPPDGSDAEGDGLLVTIRIGADGRVYFHDITAGLIPVAQALDPNDTSMSHRAEAATHFNRGTTG